MKKGFTIVELLAVIIILGIIMVISIPRVLSTIEKSRAESFRLTANNILDSAKKYITVNYKEMKEVKSKTFKIQDGKFLNSAIPMSGELPNEGKITIKFDGTVSMIIKSDRWCAIKKSNEENIQISDNLEECELLEPAPEYCFEFEDGTITSYDYENEECPRDLIIPDEINGQPVVAIDDSAFEIYALDLSVTPGLTSVVIPDTILNIGDYAFDGYNGDLDDCGGTITNVKLPSHLQYIGEGIFECNQLTSLTIPDSVEEIYAYAFRDNQLTSINIPSSVTYIENGAFAYNQLTDLDIPDTVTYLGDGAFTDNQLPDDKAFIYGRDEGGAIDNTYLSSYGGAKRSNIVIPSTVVGIGEDSFSSCGITSVTIPNGVGTIGWGAFSGNQLTTLIIPDSVTYIGSDAFSYNQLTSIEIPTSLTSISSYIFDNNQLTSVTIPNNIEKIWYGAFANNQISTLNIGTGVTYIANSVFYENHLTTLTIPNNVTTIDSYVFQNNQLTNVTIGSGVTAINAEAFRYNYIPQGNLTIDRTSGSVTIGSNAFANNGASQLTTITPVYLR